MSDKPKPCPFCGSEAILDGAGDCEWWSVRCSKCHVFRGYFVGPSGGDYALAAWNRRALPWVAVAERLPEPEQLCLWWGNRIRKPLVSSYAEGLDTEFFTHWLPLSPDFSPAVDKLAQGGAGK